jgi:SAM-dependent methyltransferase
MNAKILPDLMDFRKHPFFHKPAKDTGTFTRILEHSHELAAQALEIVQKKTSFKPKVIVVVGFGSNWLELEYFARRFPQATIYGIDSTAIFIEQAKHNLDYKNIILCCNDILSINLFDHVDLLFSSHVLINSHKDSTDPLGLINTYNHMKKLLKKEGIIISSPALFSSEHARELETLFCEEVGLKTVFIAKK